MKKLSFKAEPQIINTSQCKHCTMYCIKYGTCPKYPTIFLLLKINDVPIGGTELLP